MLLIKQNESVAGRRHIIFKVVDATDGYTPRTGLSFGASEIKVSQGAGAESNYAGGVSEIGGGVYRYEPTAGEVSTLGPLCVRITKSGIRDALFVAQVVAFDPYTAVDTTIFDSANAVETGMTLRQALRLLTAVIGGKVSGGSTTTEIFRNAVADSKARVTATVDNSGNRSAISYDLS